MSPAAPLMSRCTGHLSGKVREMYWFDNLGLMVTTDRISTYDRVHPTRIPDKGRVLTGLTAFWLNILKTPHHLITTDLDEMRRLDGRIDFGTDRDWYEGRCMLVRKAHPIPVECVVRGYLAGSGWADYQRTGHVCGVRLPEGLQECAQLPQPIFTPATKAPHGP